MSEAIPHRAVAVVHGRREAPRTLRRPFAPRRLQDLGPAASVVPAVLATALVQALDPASSALPAGQSRFDVAGAWASLAPGALAGLPVPAPTATGWVQLGLLQRVLLGGTAQSVEEATHGLLILLAVASVALLWVLLRRIGTGLLAAGVAAAAFGVAPEAVAVHGAASTGDLAVTWLLLAGVLATRRRGSGGPLAAGVVAGLALLANPLAIAGVPLIALLEGAPPRRAVRAVEEPADRPRARLVVAVAALAGVLVLAGIVSLVLAVVPQTEAGRSLAALAAAAPAPGAGTASLAAWLARDPLSLLLAAIAVIAAAVRGRRVVTATAAVLALLSVWPAGHDATAPAALLLPLVAAALAGAVDAAVVTLGHRLFRVSVVGAGWLMGVAALLVVSLAIWLGSFGGRSVDESRTAAETAAWIDSTVPAGQTVLVDLAAWPDAQNGARADVGWYAAGATGGVVSSVPWSSASWVVANGALRRSANGSAAAALGAGRAIARFGTGQDAVQVLALPPVTSRPSTLSPSGSGSLPGVSTSPAPSASVSAAVTAARRSAGTELASNPALTVSAPDRALLTSGQVDARVSIALGQLLSGHDLTVAGFPVVPAETGARRQVLVAAVDGHPVPASSTAAGIVLRYFSALRGAYAIATVDEGADGVLVTFPADSTFIPSS